MVMGIATAAIVAARRWKNPDPEAGGCLGIYGIVVVCVLLGGC